MKVFVLGITGRTGRRIAALLLEQEHAVIGLVRHPEQAEELAGLGVKVTLGDIATGSQQHLAEAIAPADAVVFAAGASDTEDDSMLDAVDYGGVVKTIAAMKVAGRSRLLAISVFPEAARAECLGESFEHYMLAKKKADIAVVNSGLDWLILRPSSLSDERGTGRVSLALANLHTEITRDDVAATAVALLQTPALSRLILEVTAGEQPIAEAVSALKGKE